MSVVRVVQALKKLQRSLFLELLKLTQLSKEPLKRKGLGGFMLSLYSAPAAGCVSLKQIGYFESK